MSHIEFRAIPPETPESRWPVLRSPIASPVCRSGLALQSRYLPVYIQPNIFNLSHEGVPFLCSWCLSTPRLLRKGRPFIMRAPFLCDEGVFLRNKRVWR